MRAPGATVQFIDSYRTACLPTRMWHRTGGSDSHSTHS